MKLKPKADEERERERGRPFFRGNIESKINHPGSKRWRSWFTSNRSSSRGKKWALSINYCPARYVLGPRTICIRLDCDSMTRDRFFLGTMRALYALSIRGIRHENYHPSVMNLIVFLYGSISFNFMFIKQ